MLVKETTFVLETSIVFVCSSFRFFVSIRHLSISNKL